MAMTWSLEERKRENEEKGKIDGEGATLIVWCRGSAGKHESRRVGKERQKSWVGRLKTLAQETKSQEAKGRQHQEGDHREAGPCRRPIGAAYHYCRYCIPN